MGKTRALQRNKSVTVFHTIYVSLYRQILYFIVHLHQPDTGHNINKTVKNWSSHSLHSVMGFKFQYCRSIHLTLTIGIDRPPCKCINTLAPSLSAKCESSFTEGYVTIASVTSCARGAPRPSHSENHDGDGPDGWAREGDAMGGRATDGQESINHQMPHAYLINSEFRPYAPPQPGVLHCLRQS